MAKCKLNIIKNIFKWLMIALLIIFIGVLTLAWFKVPVLLKKGAIEWISNKSNGTYELQVSSLKMSFLKWGFSLEDVIIQPSDFIPDSKDSLQKTEYSFSSPEINVRGVGVWHLLFDKDLIINKIEVYSPVIKINGELTSKKESDSEYEIIIQELKPLFKEKIYSLQIDEIELIDAKYNAYNSISGDVSRLANTGNVTLGIKNFYTDWEYVSTPDRLFEAKDIFIRVVDYKNELQDSLHTLSADELYYSLKKGLITGTNVFLSPDSVQEKRNRYRVRIPFMKLTSDNFYDFFISDSLYIDSLFLCQPEIEFYPRPKSDQFTFQSISNFDLYNLVGHSFKVVAVNHFLVDKAHLMLYNYRDSCFLQQKMNEMSLQLDSFYLDSVAEDNPDKIFYSEHLQLEVNDYEINLGDNNHKVEIGKLIANTKEKFIWFYHAKVRPVSESAIKSNENIVIRVDCDSLKVDGADMVLAYHSRKLPIQKVELYKPITTIDSYGNGNRKTRKSSSLVYEMISDYFKAIYVNLVFLENGTLRFNDFANKEQPGYIQSGIEFQLTDFALDQRSVAKSNKLFFATNIDLTFSNYEMQLIDQLHRLNIGRVNISSLKKKAVVEQLHLYPVAEDKEARQKLRRFGNSKLYEVKIPYLYFFNTDVHKALFDEKLTIGNIRIVEPKIGYESFATLRSGNKKEFGVDEFYQLMSNYIRDFDVREIEAKNGEMKLTNHDRKGNTIGLDNKFNLKLEKFRLNRNEIGKRKLFFSENVDLRIQKYLFRLADHIHYLQAGEIGLSTFESKVYMKNAILYPDITNPDYKKLPLNIHVSIPSVSFSGVDVLGLYFDGNLRAERFDITQPDISFYKLNKAKTETNIKEINILLPEKLRKLEINNFTLGSGRIQIFKEMGQHQERVLSGMVDMQGQNLKIENRQKQNPLISGNFKTDIKDLSFEPHQKNLKVNLGLVSYSTSSRNISIKDLLIAPRKKVTSKNQFMLKIPDAQLHSFNIDMAYNHNQYYFDRISVDKPEFVYYQNVADTGYLNPYTISLYPYFEDFADVFESKDVNITNGTYTLHAKEKTTRQNNLNLQLSNFKVEKNNTSHFLCSDQFVFRIYDITRFDKKKRYKFHFDQIGFSSSDNCLFVKDISLEPQYSKEQYSRMLRFQSDYFSGNLKEIRFEDVDAGRWFEKQQIVGKRLCLDGLNLSIYRDKRVEFNENNRPPMPQELIRNFDLPFFFDSLQLNNANIYYAEELEGAQELSAVSFKKVNACWKPFTNIPSKNWLAQVNVKGRLMGDPLISVQVKMDMNSAKNRFEVAGEIEPCLLEIINPIIRPATLMEINTGVLNDFEFRFSGDDRQATGGVKFAYDDLNISILEIKNGDTRKSKFPSFMANSLIIKSKTKKNKIEQPEDICYRRDPSRSIFNYWWKSVFDGIKNGLGLKDKKDKK